MEDDNDSDEEGGGNNEGVNVPSEGGIMGYGLPECNREREVKGAGVSAETVRRNMMTILEECRACTSSSSQKRKRPVQGPAMGPPPGGAATFASHIPVEFDDSDEDEGPAPIGSKSARRRLLATATSASPCATADGKPYVAKEGEREEWMLVPGEHDFLKGIKAGTVLGRSRKFKNEKTRGGDNAIVLEVHASAEARAEMEAIRKAHVEARGPSLVELHRQKKAEDKAAEMEAEKTGKKNKWGWSRDQNLDDGRRVDKNNLRMIMGGAGGELRDKFQGGLSKGFM